MEPPHDGDRGPVWVGSAPYARQLPTLVPSAGRHAAAGKQWTTPDTCYQGLGNRLCLSGRGGCTQGYKLEWHDIVII